MHICFVCREYIPSLRGGGIASYVYNMAHIFNSKGHKVTVICASDNTYKSENDYDNGINVIRLSGGDFYIEGAEDYNIMKKLRVVYRFHSYRKKLVRVIKEIEDIDIIEVADFGAESLYFDKLNVPYIIRLHNPSLFDSDTLKIKKLDFRSIYFYYQARKEIELIAKASYISSCSEGMKNWVLDNIKDVMADIRVIYNPIEINKLEIPKREKNKPVIFYAGTISEWKGCRDLIMACEKLISIGVDFDLYMAGKMGKYAYRLQDSYKNHKWIHFLGKLDHNQLFDYYKNSTVVCLPSWWDNMPMVCIEAMMCGAVVIGSTSGGMKEIITDKVDGFHVRRKSVDELTDLLKYCLQLDQTDRIAISNKAKNKIYQKFSSDIIYEQMISYYHYVINDFKNNRI